MGFIRLNAQLPNEGELIATGPIISANIRLVGFQPGGDGRIIIGREPHGDVIGIFPDVGFGFTATLREWLDAMLAYSNQNSLGRNSV